MKLRCKRGSNENLESDKVRGLPCDKKGNRLRGLVDFTQNKEL